MNIMKLKDCVFPDRMQRKIWFNFHQRRFFCDYTIHKSFQKHQPILAYCESMSTPLPEVLKNLQTETLKRDKSAMMASPEVLQMNMFFIKISNSKKILDIGVFTGCSTMASALAAGKDGKVIALEKSRKNVDIAKQFWTLAGVEEKVELQIGPAIDKLDELIALGNEQTFDFAFIDADKRNYVVYFEKCLNLLKSGGIIALDNSLFKGKVINTNSSEKTVQEIQAANRFIKADSRVDVLMLNIGDGYTIVIKK